MLPTLISWGPLKIYAYGLCLFMGIFFSLYAWWKMGRDEHLEEIALFDGYFLSLLTYFVVGRLGYVALHWSELGTLYRTLAILAYPGLSGVVGLIASTIVLLLFARAQNWHIWKVLDMYSVALLLALVLVSLGAILNGTQNPWLLNVWQLVWAILSFGVVSRVRKNFRFYAWYKGEASMAEEGLASLIMILLVGIYYLGAGVVTQSLLIPGALLVMVSAYSIWLKAGKRNVTLGLIQWWRKKRG